MEEINRKYSEIIFGNNNSMIQLNKILVKEAAMEKDYYLGLDMGSGSAGWAVTDDQYHVLRAHGKTMWGTRLFESANTAEEREIRELNGFRKFLQRKSIRRIQDFSGV